MDTLDNHEIPQQVVTATDKRAASREIFVQAQICIQCKQQKALNEEEFAPLGRGKGFDQMCRVCRDYQESVAHGKVEKKMVARILSAIEKGNSVPQQADLLGFYYEQMGGPKGVAVKMANLWDKAYAAGDWKVCMRGIDIITRLQMHVSRDHQDLLLSDRSKEEVEESVNNLKTMLIDMVVKDPEKAQQLIEHQVPDGE